MRELFVCRSSRDSNESLMPRRISVVRHVALQGNCWTPCVQSMPVTLDRPHGPWKTVAWTSTYMCDAQRHQYDDGTASREPKLYLGNMADRICASGLNGIDAIFFTKGWPCSSTMYVADQARAIAILFVDHD